MSALLWDHERELAAGCDGAVCGVDEAGRGPLAGPVCAAAVVLPADFSADGLNDSKKLTAARRDALYDRICSEAIAWAVAFSDVQEIEEHNILGATFLAMRRAVSQLAVQPALALVDGNRDPGLPCQSICVVGGDGLCVSIAAASVLAKVTRDRYMCELAGQYPEYGFDGHKGYGTKRHYEALRQHGPCPAHRPSFLKKMH